MASRPEALESGRWPIAESGLRGAEESLAASELKLLGATVAHPMATV